MGKVISVFTGLGKTTVGNKYANVYDLQSSPYRCDYSNISKDDYEKMKCISSRIAHPEWPNNYLKAILKAIKEYEVVLVPSNLDIRELLSKNNIDFILILPNKDSEIREKLLQRYKLRGNSDELIESAMNNFDNWSRNQEDYNYPIIILDNNQYLEDVLLEMKLIK